jgi:hypothetical protein
MPAKGGCHLSKERLRWIEACEKAREIVCRSPEMGHLYGRALQYHGEGELGTGILSLAFEAVQDENLRNEVFASEEGMLSFFCGIWIQFLLTEIGGLNGEDLRTLAMKVFREVHGGHALH